MVCSAFPSFRDVLNEAEYEEIDHVVTTKEDLLDNTGVYPCLVLLGPLGVSSLLSVSQGFSESVDPLSIPGSQEQLLQRLQDGFLLSPCEL